MFWKFKSDRKTPSALLLSNAFAMLNNFRLSVFDSVILFLWHSLLAVSQRQLTYFTWDLWDKQPTITPEFSAFFSSRLRFILLWRKIGLYYVVLSLTISPLVKKGACFSKMTLTLEFLVWIAFETHVQLFSCDCRAVISRATGAWISSSTKRADCTHIINTSKIIQKITQKQQSTYTYNLNFLAIHLLFILWWYSQYKFTFLSLIE